MSVEQLMSRFRDEDIYFEVTAQEYPIFCDFCRQTDTYFGGMRDRKFHFTSTIENTIERAGVAYLTYGFVRTCGVQYAVPRAGEDGHYHLDAFGWKHVVFADMLAELDMLPEPITEAELFDLLGGA